MAAMRRKRQPDKGRARALTDKHFLFVCSRNKLQKKHRAALKDRCVPVLGIPDQYDFMDEHLIRLLDAKMRPWLPTC